MRKNCFILLSLFLIIVNLGFAQQTLNLNLEESIDLAIKNNLVLAQQEKRISQAQANIIVARSGFYPSISTNYNTVRLGKIPAVEMETPLGSQTITMGGRYNYSFQGIVQQPLFTWGKISNSYKLAISNFSLQEINYQQSLNNLKHQVTVSFYNVLLAQEMVKLTEESYNQMAKHVEQVEKMYKNGLATNFDLLRTKVQLANFEPQKIRAKNGLELAKDSFLLLLNLETNTPFELNGQLQYQPLDMDLDKAIETALQKRPEIYSLQETKKIAQLNYSLVSASNKPAIIASYNYVYQRPYRWRDVWGEDWNIAISLSWPIFNGLSTRGKVLEAKAQIEELEKVDEQLKDSIKIEVKNAYLRCEQETINIKSQQENVKQAQEALKIAQEQYQMGLITNLEYMDTQLSLEQARINYLQALSNYLTAHSEFILAIGGKI